METITSVLVTLVGLCILVLASIAITVKSRGNQVVSWHGLGITFEIKPCATCASCKRKEKHE